MNESKATYRDILLQREAKDHEIAEAEKRLAKLREERDALNAFEKRLWWESLPRTVAA
jgi:hypothetical protein